MIFAVLLLSCPWLNHATAAGILGGPVIQTGCDFKGTLELHIEMIQDFKSRCGPDAVPLKALGSEAVACGDQVVVRVRDKAFLVRIKDREKALKIAEMIAGSLF
ncbi:MAG: hypothetical protein ABSF22_00305 [Bryobacteraceae bacterium]|jgi:hypothetical protein